MAGKKDSTIKKVGRFVNNELLGIDDAKRAFKYAKQGQFKKAAKSAAAGAVEVATTLAPVGAGSKVGKIAGKALARSVAKEASPKVLKAANAAKGSGKMTYPKAATGKTTSTAAKRDVVVKTQDKTLKGNGFISRSGEKSVKVNTNKPKVRVVEKEVTKKQADKITAGTNKLRYGSAKQEASRSRAAVSDSKMLPKAGERIGSIAGLSASAAKSKKKK